MKKSILTIAVFVFTVTKNEKVIEAFSMMFDKDMTLKMGWGDTVVSVSIK